MRPTHATPRPLAVLALSVVAILAVGCGGQPAPTAEAVPSPTPAPTATVAPADPHPTSPPEPDPTPTTTVADAALVARAEGELAVHESPGDPTPAATLPATTDFGTPTVVLVAEEGEGAAHGWLRVLLPTRPNGATGWIRADDVELRDVTLEVRVDLATRELVVLDAGTEVLATPTAIGDPEHPTPTGRFYVVDKLESPDPDGAYGPYAIGLSAHSDVLTEFAGGDGQVGIHGTNAPSSIGRDVSHGCMRVDNEVIEELAHLLPLGTPVTIS